MSTQGFPRHPVLLDLYDQFLADEDTAALIHRVNHRYNQAALTHLLNHHERLVRRAAALALGYVGDYECNSALGRALHDSDRGVRMLAESGIRSVWCRVGSERQRREIATIITLNTTKKYQQALERASALTELSPDFAEGWNQLAIAQYCLEYYVEAISSCNDALEINPYHFGAAAGMGQCYLKLDEQALALEAFRRALNLNPGLEGVRANVVYLERALER